MRLYRVFTLCGAIIFCSGGVYAETISFPATITKVAITPSPVTALVANLIYRQQKI
ncbi:hypothetical protein [Aquella oligotrophica]|uniref:hypothetical protein n=1 Tax=Aquella oligotrophica TaxID=2067065 RepID=UPI0013158D47|nr:hypothetical protein [Aquella oligotrophica]